MSVQQWIFRSGLVVAANLLAATLATAAPAEGECLAITMKPFPRQAELGKAQRELSEAQTQWTKVNNEQLRKRMAAVNSGQPVPEQTSPEVVKARDNVKEHTDRFDKILAESNKFHDEQRAAAKKAGCRSHGSDA